MHHDYTARVIWTGNRGEGTATYTGYGRQYRVLITGKPELSGSADVAFRGDADRYNPEDLLISAIAACHMLSYLALCARQSVRVTAYEDRASGTLVTRDDGGGRFESVTLAPVVTIADSAQEALALQLHEAAHAQCFIANSCSMPVHHRATVKAEGVLV